MQLIQFLIIASVAFAVLYALGSVAFMFLGPVGLVAFGLLFFL